MKAAENNEKFLCINQCVNIFDIISCKEEQASQIIAWLLNPREAHGLGDIFFDRFLEVISPESDVIYGYKYKKNKIVRDAWKKKDILKKAYSDVVIQTEYNIHTNIKENRIDILLCLEQAKSIFVIENKYGSKEHNSQTKQYFKHFSHAKYKNYTIFYIYLDVWDYYVDGGLSDKEHWYLINYDWITKVLKKNENKKNVVSKLLHDIYLEFSGNNEDEAYFKPFWNQRKEISKKYENIKGIGRYEILKKNKNSDAFNYRKFYDMVNDISFWEKYINIDNYIYQSNEKKFRCYINPKKMYLTPLKIDKKYRTFIESGIKGLDWPIYCRLEYKDNKINFKLKYPKKNLSYFENPDSLKKQLDEKKKQLNKNSKEPCTLDELPQKLDKFLEACTEAFNIIQKEKYIK